MALNTVDPQIGGIQDDGSPEGVLRSKMISGNLVRVPASALIWGVTVFLDDPRNPDGSNSYVKMDVAAGLGSAVGQFNTYFRGRSLVLCVRVEGVSAPHADFTAVVDGKAYPVKAGKTIQNPPFTQLTAPLREKKYLIADNLSQGHHHLQIILHPSASGSKTLSIYGLELEKSAGYQPIKKADYMFAAGVAVASGKSAVPVTQTISSTTIIANAVKRIIYKNTSGSNVDVSLFWGRTNASSPATFWAKTIAAGAYEVYDFPESGMCPGTAGTAADGLVQDASATGLQVTVIGTQI